MLSDINAVSSPITVLRDTNAVKGFSVASNTTGPMLYWENIEGLNTHVDAVFYDDGFKNWSKPVVVSEGITVDSW